MNEKRGRGGGEERGALAGREGVNKEERREGGGEDSGVMKWRKARMLQRGGENRRTGEQSGKEEGKDVARKMRGRGEHVEREQCFTPCARAKVRPVTHLIMVTTTSGTPRWICSLLPTSNL